jgi:3-methyladenine DNA glycosylase/8-oxoguanine DNA glycosylase
MRLTVSARPPFSLSAVVGSHGWVRLAPFARDPDTGALVRVEQLDSGQVVALRIEEEADPGGAGSGVSVATEASLTEAEGQEVADKVGWMMGLDQDLTPFYDLAREEPKLARMEERAQGRLLRSPTLFEDVVKTILTTNTAWNGTIRMAEALVTLYGAPLPGDPERRTFPTPGRLAATGEEALRAEARLGYRAPYVLALARDVASGELDLEALKDSDRPAAELRKRLLALKGVGGYAAANLLMILGRYDYVPVDSWALKMVSREWYGGEPVGQAEVEAAFERWGQWKGLAYWFWDWSDTG